MDDRVLVPTDRIEHRLFGSVAERMIRGDRRSRHDGRCLRRRYCL